MLSRLILRKLRKLIVHISEIRGRKLFGDTFVTGNEEDLRRASILRYRYNITSDDIRIRSIELENETLSMWTIGFSHSANVLQYLALNDFLGPELQYYVMILMNLCTAVRER